MHNYYIQGKSLSTCAWGSVCIMCVLYSGWNSNHVCRQGTAQVPLISPAFFISQTQGAGHSMSYFNCSKLEDPLQRQTGRHIPWNTQPHTCCLLLLTVVSLSPKSQENVYAAIGTRVHVSGHLISSCSRFLCPIPKYLFFIAGMNSESFRRSHNNLTM